MQKYVEQRGGYQVAYYTVELSREMRDHALAFAKSIILTDNQYSRLLPADVWHSGDVQLRHKLEIQRTYMGKLGELAFLEYLRQNGKPVQTDGMFEIYAGQENVDSFDFVTKTGRTVDVKTGFRRIHTRLLVNTQQFDGIPKDYYVAVKINAEDVDEQQKLVDWEKISTATIFGYAEHSHMERRAPVANFGEGPARWLYYKQLMGIDRLLSEF